MRFAFQPPPGLFSDDTTFASPGVWEDGSNMRARLGNMEVIGGWGLAFADTLTGVCRNSIAWTENDGSPTLAFGTHSALHVYTDGTLFDITPTGLAAGNEHSSAGSPGWGSGTWGMGTWSTPASDYYARTWSFGTYGESLIANPRGGTIYQWENDPLTEAAEVTNAPAQVNCILVTEQRQVAAFGCNEEVSGNFNPLAIRWSNIEDITDWTTASDNNAGEYILEGGGRIVMARQIGQDIAVWTDSALFWMRFIGEPGQTFFVDCVARNSGLIAPNAVHVVEQTAIWIAPDYQFRIWQLGGAPNILPCPIWKDFVGNLATSQKEKIVATGVSKFGECWFFYPDARDGNENSRYVAYSLGEASNPWFKGVMPRTAAMDAGAIAHPIMTSPEGQVYYHEYGSFSGEWFVKSADQYVDEGGRAMQVQGIEPDFENQSGEIELTIQVRGNPQSDPIEKGPFVLTPGLRKRDFRATGRVLSVRLHGTGYARLGKPVFPLVEAGRRA